MNMSVREMEMTTLISVAGFLVGAVGLFLALVGVVIAVWQVRHARKVSKLEGDIIALEAFLTAELAGKKDKEVIKKLLELIFVKVEQLGSRDVLKMKDVFKT